MINTIVLVGRLTKDIEVRKTSSDLSVTSFTLAVERNTKGKETDFISCQAWRQSADFLGNYAHKGNLVGVTGSINTSHYINNKGDTVYKTEVVCNNVQLLESKGASNEDYQTPRVNTPKNDYGNEDSLNLDDSSLPF